MVREAIAYGQVTLISYGQSIDDWAAVKLDGALGVVLGVLGLVLGSRIMSHKKKEENEKVKDLGFMVIGLVCLAAVVMFFIHHYYGGVVSRLDNTAN